MAPVFFFLLFISLTAIPPGATDNGNQMGNSSDIFAIIDKANKDLTFLKQGDIVFSRKRNADLCTENGCKWPKLRKHVIVPFLISTHFTRKERNFIKRALRTFHSSTCVHFVPYRKQRHYIYFIPGAGCWSYVGRQSRGQSISLHRPGCMHTSIVQHEILHALGIHHEIVRSDRDNYVEIRMENVQEGKEKQFEKLDTNNLLTPYDFDSVMEYSNYAFSKNGEPTIIPKDDPDRKFGHAPYMSQNDIERINRLYECDI